MARDFVVEVVGLVKVEGKLRHLPAWVRPFFERAARFGQERMADYARPHEGDKGTLAEGVAYEITGETRPLEMEARVGFLGRGFGARSSIANLARVVNRGRRPGKVPSIRAIRRWLKSHGYQGNPRAIQKRVAAQGTKGVQFLERAEKDIREKLPELQRQVSREIEQRWNS